MDKRGLNGLQMAWALSHHWRCQKLFSGIYAMDELKRVPKHAKIIIVNTDVSTGKGIHWILVEMKSVQQQINIYDSLGLPWHCYSPLLIDFVTRRAQKIKLLKERTLPMNSSLCGYYCLYYAYRCSFDESMELIERTTPSPQWIQQCVPILFEIISKNCTYYCI